MNIVSHAEGYLLTVKGMQVLKQCVTEMVISVVLFF